MRLANFVVGRRCSRSARGWQPGVGWRGGQCDAVSWCAKKPIGVIQSGMRCRGRVPEIEPIEVVAASSLDRQLLLRRRTESHPVCVLGRPVADRQGAVVQALDISCICSL